jgi:hypothetical protein
VTSPVIQGGGKVNGRSSVNTLPQASSASVIHRQQFNARAYTRSGQMEGQTQIPLHSFTLPTSCKDASHRRTKYLNDPIQSVKLVRLNHLRRTLIINQGNEVSCCEETGQPFTVRFNSVTIQILSFPLR